MDVEPEGADDGAPPPAAPAPSWQLTAAITTCPVTCATFSRSGLIDTSSSSAVAAAECEVTVFRDSHRLTLPTPGTATCVGPAALSETFSPRTSISPSTLTCALGCPPAGQSARACTASIPSSPLPSSPGTFTRAFSRSTAACEPLLSAVAELWPTLASTSDSGPWPTPATVAVSRLPSWSPGAWMELSTTSTGMSTVLFSSFTSRPSRAVVAEAVPVPSPEALAGAAANADGPAANRETAANAPRAAAERRMACM